MAPRVNRWDRHNATCAHPATAFHLHPHDYGVLPFSELWGVPLVCDDSVAVKAVRIDCAGRSAD